MIPACAAITMTAWTLISSLKGSTNMFYLFLAGAAFWGVLFFVFPKPLRTYIFAHELTHALWAWLSGARVSKFNVKAKGGSVHVSKTNFLITLAPYFFPLYAIILICIYSITTLFLDVSAYHTAWIFFIGIAWGFHITFTVDMLLTHQPDIKSNGHLFSYTLIFFLNLLFLNLSIVTMTPCTMEMMVIEQRKSMATCYTAPIRWVAKIKTSD